MLKIEDLVQVYEIGNAIHETKFVFKHDVKINVADAVLDAKSTDLLTIPRWIADILESDEHGEIQEDDLVKQLDQTIVKENLPKLSTLEPDFYIKLRSYMKKLHPKEFDKAHSLLNELVRKRRGKIIRHADTFELTGDLTKALSVEERFYYELIYNYGKKIEKEIFRDLQ